MHQTLRIPEILLNIFGHFSRPMPEKRSDNADLAVLARVCRTFKEPGLDVLWEELYDLSSLARCIPEACRLAKPTEEPVFTWAGTPCYLFSRPLNEAERKTLRGYARRVWFIRGLFDSLHKDTIEDIFSLAPLSDPLFPHLRSLHWDSIITSVPLHAAVPSLTTLRFTPHYLQSLIMEEFFRSFGDRCPHMEKLIIVSYPSYRMDSIISHLVCRWPKLQEVLCLNVALSMDAISYLSSVSKLRRLEFTMDIRSIQDISHLDSKLVFSNLINLGIKSRLIGNVISFFRYTRLPAIETFYVLYEGYVSRQAIQAWWTAVQEACPSNVLTSFVLCVSIAEREVDGVPVDEEVLPCIVLEDLHSCTAFNKLRELYVNFNCPVNLTDGDLLELVSPQMESFLINYEYGWWTGVDGGGITLSGLVQLLRQCPSLNHLCLAIDTRTFTEIPEGLDVSFPPRARLKINLLDSYILPEFVLGLVSVLTALGQDSSMLIIWEMGQFTVSRGQFRDLWDSVLGELSAC